ncbi:MAG: hypothetical protein HZA77_14410 [Candidatus Schekmanbacteria bacterium]|nr:hypothetical protein [Candidatus Schekmanbacteria bacterium]
MKNREIVKVLCLPYCSFYKEGKEEMLCLCAELLMMILESDKRELVLNVLLSKGSEKRPDEKVYYHDRQSLEHLCSKCGFYITECDFTDPDFKGYSNPCGGFMAIMKLLKAQAVSWDEIVSVVKA